MMNYRPRGHLPSDYEKYVSNAKKLSGNFLAHAATHEIGSIDNRGPITATDVIEEVMAVAGLLATAGLSPELLPPGTVEWSANELNDTYCSIITAVTLAQALPYFWMHDIRTAAEQQSALPAHNSDDLHPPHPAMWWRWEKGLRVWDHDGNYRDGLGALIMHTDEGYQFVEVACNRSEQGKTKMILTVGVLCPLNWRYPDDFDNSDELVLREDAKEMYEFVAKLIAFVNSPFITVESQRPARAMRRELLKRQVAHAPEVNFVTLRRRLVKGAKVSEGPGRTLTQRILTSGHYRNHWWPKEEKHVLTWIHPYLRGPEGAPLKQRAYKVVR